MKIIETNFKDLKIYQKQSFKDRRGYTRELFNNKLLNKKFPFDLISLSKKNVIRGLHLQIKKPQGKFITVLRGKIFDVVVDLRPKSKTYMKWCSFQINERNKNLIHIPKGCANAFLTLKNNTIVQYNSSEFYKPKHEKGIRYNDPLFKFKWPQKPKIISNKDLSHPNYIMIK